MFPIKCRLCKQPKSHSITRQLSHTHASQAEWHIMWLNHTKGRKSALMKNFAVAAADAPPSPAPFPRLLKWNESTRGKVNYGQNGIFSHLISPPLFPPLIHLIAENPGMAIGSSRTIRHGGWPQRRGSPRIRISVYASFD